MSNEQDAVVVRPPAHARTARVAALQPVASAPPLLTATKQVVRPELVEHHIQNAATKTMSQLLNLTEENSGILRIS